LFVLSIAALAFTSGLAAACFVKAFGAAFLARPRSDAVAQAQERSFLMKLSMVTLALLTLVVGFNAGSIARVLAVIAGSVARFGEARPFGVFSAQGVQLRDGFAMLSMPSVLVVVLFGIACAWLLSTVAARNQKSVIDLTWDCGSALTRHMEITATGFSHSIITVMRGVLRPTRQTEVEYHDAALRYFPTSSHVHFGVPDIYTRFYLKMAGGLALLSKEVRRIQNGNINVYILYILIVLIALLLLLSF
jgi:hypothetical protein